MSSHSESASETGCKAIRLLIDKITTAVLSYSQSPPTTKPTTLLKLRQLLVESVTHVDQQPNSIFNNQAFWTVSPTAASQALAAEHLLFISSFTSLLTALLHKMDRTLWNVSSPRKHEGFLVLWGILYDTCSIFCMFPRQWPTPHLPDSSSLYPTLHNLMLFLLPITTPSSTCWAPPLGSLVTSEGTRVMITPMLDAFTNMCESSSAETLLDSIGSLPPAFINTLCYIACERLDSSVVTEVAMEFFRELCTNIFFCVTRIQIEPRNYSIAAFCKPAILEVAKRGFLAMHSPCTRIPPAHIDRARLLLVSLYNSLTSLTVPGDAQSTSATSLSGTNAPSTPHMSPSVETPDRWLLNETSKQNTVTDVRMQLDCMLMLKIMRSWPGSAAGHPVADMSDYMASLLYISRCGSVYMCRWMVGLRKQMKVQQQQPPRQPRQSAPSLYSYISGLQNTNVMHMVYEVMLQVYLLAYGCISSGECFVVRCRRIEDMTWKHPNPVLVRFQGTQSWPIVQMHLSRTVSVRVYVHRAKLLCTFHIN